MMFEINSFLRSDIKKLEGDLSYQSEISKSLDSNLKLTQAQFDDQQTKMKQLETNFTISRQSDNSHILELENKINSIQANITNVKNNTESIINRVVKLEEKINLSTPIVSNKNKFNTEILSNANDNWTALYIKKDLYDANSKSSCNTPYPVCYVNISQQNTLVGTAIAVDTIGSSDHGYYFMGYSDKYIVPPDGVVKISGDFLKRDKLTLSGLGGESTLSVFILGEIPNIIINKTTLLGGNYTNDVWFSKDTVFDLAPGSIFRVGFGGIDSWTQDYGLYDSWARVSINGEPAK